MLAALSRSFVRHFPEKAHAEASTRAQTSRRKKKESARHPAPKDAAAYWVPGNYKHISMMSRTIIDTTVDVYQAQGLYTIELRV